MDNFDHVDEQVNVFGLSEQEIRILIEKYKNLPLGVEKKKLGNLLIKIHNGLSFKYLKDYFDKNDNFGEGAAVGAAVGSAFPVIGTVAGGLVGSIADIFIGAGGKEDKSTTGYQQALGTLPRSTWYPSKEELFNASNGWQNHLRIAIGKGYNPIDGTINYSGNDWKGIVTSNTPIAVKWFKGSGEQFPAISNVYAKANQPISANVVKNTDGATVTLKANNNMLLYISLGVGVLVILYFFFRK